MECPAIEMPLKPQDIVILKIIRSKNNKVRQIRVSNIITPPNGLSFNEQSIMVKKVFYQLNHPT